MNKILFLAVFFTLFISTYTNNTIIKVPLLEYPPASFLNKDFSWEGLDVDLSRAVIEEAGFTPEYTATPWSTSFKFIKSGHMSLMPNLSKTTERSEYMNWIGPERVAEIVLIVKKENLNLEIKTIDDLLPLAQKMNQGFGIEKYTIYSDEFSEKLKNPEFRKYIEAVNQTYLNPRKTRNNRILGFFMEKNVFHYLNKTDKDFQNLAVHPFVLNYEVVYFGISKKLPDSDFKKLESAYNKLEKNGTLDKIRNRY